jgi:hypothetical protein
MTMGVVRMLKWKRELLASIEDARRGDGYERTIGPRPFNANRTVRLRSWRPDQEGTKFGVEVACRSECGRSWSLTVDHLQLSRLAEFCHQDEPHCDHILEWRPTNWRPLGRSRRSSCGVAVTYWNCQSLGGRGCSAQFPIERVRDVFAACVRWIETGERDQTPQGEA